MEYLITKEWLKAFTYLNEMQKRLFAAEKSIELGYGGISEVSRATGLSRTTITQGRRELLSSKNLESNPKKLEKKAVGEKNLQQIKN